jgi:iron complex outermembrane receptor protein
MYGQEQIDLSHFTVIIGGRADFTAQDTFNRLTNQPVNSQSPHAFSGRAGISYHINGFAPYFSYSTSFLPTLGADLHGQPYVPTTGSNVEGGVKLKSTLMERSCAASITRLPTRISSR